MANLILMLRGQTETAVADYSVNAVAYWTDDQLQDILDAHVARIDLEMVLPFYEYAGGTTIWKSYPVGAGNLEEQASLTPYWSLVDTSGNEVGTSLYAVDYIDGVIRFVADQQGHVYWLKARAYQMEKAAADVWRYKMGHAASLYNFSSENQSFSRAQWFDHCREMAQHYEGQSGITSVPLMRSDLA